MENLAGTSASDGQDSAPFESEFLEACKKVPGGIDDNALQAALPGVTVKQRVELLNKLISAGKIELLKKGNKLLYKLKVQGPAGAFGKDNEERLVYQLISDAGNQGILPKDIRTKTNLPFNFITKTLKALESKKLIKSVKPVNDAKKKVFMLYDHEPDPSLTGGTWYSGQDFETEFVDVLNDQCFRYLQQAATVAKEKKFDPISLRNASSRSTKDVCKFINSTGISKVMLSESDIECILNSLVYDGKVEKIHSRQENTIYYKVLNQIPGLAPLISMPCGMCSVSSDCSSEGPITPQKCIYFVEWLKF